jgi:cell division transport system permease protein
MNKPFHIAWQRIRRSPYQAVAALSIMTMTLFLASVFFLVAAGSHAILRYFETRPQINAFYSQTFVPQPQQLETIKAQLEATGKVSSIKYVSKDDALSIYKDLNKSDPLLLEAVTANMLPASIEVSAKNPNDLPLLAQQLKQYEGIEDVRFAQDIVDSLTKWTNSLRIIGIALVGAHIFITFSIIILIISIKVSNRREEIYIMQLIGATRGYVASPFIWEGIIYGVMGAVMAWGISYLLLLYSTGFLTSFLAGIPLLPPPILFMFEVLGGEMLLGTFVGGFGGILAVRRFLKA